MVASFLLAERGLSSSSVTEETLELTAFEIWEGKHPAGPVVIFNGKPTAYVVCNTNPHQEEILRQVRACLKTRPLAVRIDWKKGELLSARPATI
jgi:hypothetical protein